MHSNNEMERIKKGGGIISALTFNRYGFVFDSNSGDIVKPSLFLFSKNFHKKGQIYPYQNLKITKNMNSGSPDTCSFTYYQKDSDEYTWDALKNSALINIQNNETKLKQNWGCYEISVKEYDGEDGAVKEVNGQLLAQSELSNILCTLEINTEDDIVERSDYYTEYPTVFYRDIDFGDDAETAEKKRNSSLLHRILSYAPHYQIGHVDETLKFVQRTFSWNNAFITDVLNEISEEVGCLFTFETYLDEDGNATRLINAYDIAYCKTCYESVKQQVSSGVKTLSTSKYRTIVNGVCENCKSSSGVCDCGSDTGIFITTENLSSEIQLSPEGTIKNVFKVTGGDDLITAAVQGLNMSASNRIMLFSDETKAEMSDSCRNKLNSYNQEYNAKSPHYSELLETEYNIYDLVLWLQSAKMPTVFQDQRELQEEVEYILSMIQSDWNNDYYVSSYDSPNAEGSYVTAPYSLASYSISNLFKLYMDSGYSVQVNSGNINNFVPNSNNRIRWEGTIHVYATSNRDCYADINCHSSGTTTVAYHITDDAGVVVNTYTKTYPNYYVKFAFGDKSASEYKEYIEQYAHKLLADYNAVEKKNQQEKDWKLYGYEPLKNYLDGYERCIQVLQSMAGTSPFSYGGYDSVEEYLISIYKPIKEHIGVQMTILCDEINALCEYLGGYPGTVIPDYVQDGYIYQYYSGCQSALYALTQKNSAGYVGDYPFHCKICGSTNTTYYNGTNHCNSCGATGSDIDSYYTIAKQVYDFFMANYSNNKSIMSERNYWQSYFDMYNYFGSDYNELRSFIREDVYANENYISNGLNNAQIMEKAKELNSRALSQLAVACTQQYSISSSIAAIVAEKWKDGLTVKDAYQEFKLGNWIRCRINDVVYKLRVISIEYDFENIDLLTVGFSSVMKTKYGELSDLESILKQTQSIASSFPSVKHQASQGHLTSQKFEEIKKNGLNSALMNVLGGMNQEVVIDDKGILIRKYLEETGTYSKYQIKIIDRNIVFTDDNWETAKMALGYMKLPSGVDGEYVYGYGLIANVLIGDLICTKYLKIYGANGGIEINGDEIVLDKARIVWKVKPNSSDIDGLDEQLDDLRDDISNNTDNITDLNQDVNEYLGLGGTTFIDSDHVISPYIGGGYLNITGNNCYVTIDPKNMSQTNKVICVNSDNEDKFYVTHDGDVVLKGTVYATAGEFNENIKITGGYLKIAGSNCYVAIDPQNKLSTNKVICVNANNEDKFYVTQTGNVYLKGTVYASNGKFSGEIETSLGKIGGFEINSNELISLGNDYGIRIVANSGTSIGSGFYEYPAMRMYKAKIIFGKHLLGLHPEFSQINTLTTDYGYVDISCSGIFARYGQYNDPCDSNNYTFAVDTVNNSIDIGLSNRTEVTIGNKDNKVVFNGGLIFSNSSENGKGYGIRRSDESNIIRATQAHGVYIGGETSADLWLGADDIYYTGNAPMAHSSDRRIKSEIKNIDNAVAFIMGLKPCEYKLADSKSNRRHWGFIADEVEHTMLATTGDSGVFVKNPINDETDVDLNDESTYLCGLRYAEFIAPMVETIQYQEGTIKSQQETIDNLTSTVDSLTLRLQSLENIITQLTNKDGD